MHLWEAFIEKTQKSGGNFFDFAIDKRGFICYNIHRWTNAAMAQLVEHILGKDEVPGPNPGSS